MKHSTTLASRSAEIAGDGVLTGDRIQLRRLACTDAEFIVELLNEPSFKEFIGDKDVHDLAGAHRYLSEGPIGSYERHGFGLFLVSARADNAPLGICGLVKRESFEDPDLGFAFLRRHWSNGYALEAARAVMNYADEVLQLPRVIAMADLENVASVNLLEKLGFHFEQMVRMPDETEEVCQFAREI